MSQVIPLLKFLNKYLDSLSETTDSIEGVKSLMITLKVKVKRRYNDLESNFLYYIITYLDPRYKGAFFSSPITIISRIHKKISKIIENSPLPVSQEGDTSETRAKRANLTDPEEPGISAMSIKETVNAVLSSSSEEDDSNHQISYRVQLALGQYHKEIRIEPDDDPLQGRKANGEVNKTLSSI